MSEQREYLKDLESSGLEAEWRALVQGRSDAELDYQPDPEAWSILQVLHHMGELEDLRLLRIHMMLEQDDPLLPARADLSPVPSRDPSALLDRWHAARVTLIELGHSLTEAQLDRPGQHPLFGPTSPRAQFGHSEPHGRNHFEQCRANLEAFASSAGS